MPAAPRQSERQSRAMYYAKTPVITTPAPPNITENQTEQDIEPVQTDNANISIANTPVANITDSHPSIVWTAVNTTENTNVTSTKVNETDVANTTETQNTTLAPKKRNLTRPDLVKDDINIDGAAESRIVTEKPLSLETAFLQTRIPPYIESSRRVIEQDESGMDTGAIAGISFAALVLVALAGSTAFVLYRRRYLNKPQTLNDKCSNPDSSGYLDDSTVRFPQLAGGDDHPELLDGHRQAHQVISDVWLQRDVRRRPAVPST
ncbi:Uncharacterized protein OBRU01_03320 [Operophtera brumata]|uniref:Uncharacterized protein n=1 Tax=Operophtera brumata TaxID=104452 RepID=A0A0L7LKR4_OPEBR|nr:Uncharacterized protein OBRU01_03320 [Operophtera brumata]